MKIKIKREFFEEFEYTKENATLLEVLEFIKEDLDNSLSFSSGCRSGICGSCAVRVNGKETLACGHKVQDSDTVEPLKHLKIIRDLVVDFDEAYKKNKQSLAFMQHYNKKEVSIDDEKINELQSECIMCASCYSACPLLDVNTSFKGPFSLTRVWRYVSDKREDDLTTKIDEVVKDGIWDCTLCNECTVVCPQNISSKADVEKLRIKATQLGHTDPNFNSFGFGGGLSF